MDTKPKRSTVYLDPDIYTAQRLKAAQTDATISGLINEAARRLLEEDQEDLAAFADRVAEPTVSYQTFLDQLKADGKI
jgi:cytochrome c553